MKTWEERITGNSLGLTATQKVRRLILERIDNFNAINIKLDKFINCTLFLLSKLPHPERSKIRHLLTRLYPTPMLNDVPEELEIFIFTSAKDLEVLELSILGALQSSKNRVTSLTVVAPSNLELQIQKVLLGIEKITSLKFLSDEVLLAEYNFDTFKFIRPNIKMEILKVLAVLSSNCQAALVIDGDTILLKERVWVTKNKQIVLVAQEYTPSHIKFNKKLLRNYRSNGLGFVTHHQIIRRSHLEELISEKNDLLDFVRDFNKSATDYYLYSGQEFPSEWQLFGDFLINRHPGSVALSSFKNLGLSRKKVSFFSGNSDRNAGAELARIKQVVPNLASLSFHDYKE